MTANPKTAEEMFQEDYRNFQMFKWKDELNMTFVARQFHELGYRAAMAQGCRWVPVEERLPEGLDRWVLVLNLDGSQDARYFEKGKGFWNTDIVDGFTPNNSITHWLDGVPSRPSQI